MLADGLSDVARREVSIVLLSYPCVTMSKLRGNHAHRDAAHGKRTCIAVPQDVEADGRVDLGY